MVMGDDVFDGWEIDGKTDSVKSTLLAPFVHCFFGGDEGVGRDEYEYPHNVKN
jgi:hypothetical protein